MAFSGSTISSITRCSFTPIMTSLRSGIGAFDGMADAVNKIEPDTRWRNVGDIVKHLYLMRLRDDSNYDVLAFSNSVELENTSERNLVFDVKTPESGSPAVASVSVDGRDYPFELRGGD